MSRAEPSKRPDRRRVGRTRTSRFGSSKRESHDSAPFYERFLPVEISDDETVCRSAVQDEIFCQDSRRMPQVPSNSVALVITSPPYFAGKDYEYEMGTRGVPGSYIEYLDLLSDVFAECLRVLEPGGRIAVNVANLGRKPYRSLSADVINILENLGYLLRGEIVWVKGRGASGSCAWGTFANPSNPVLRDLTERVVVASKSRFDRAVPQSRRARQGLPATPTITKDEFLEATTDLWEILPESATRVGHPSPFPVSLPVRLIELYTYEEDLILDPFIGSGTTAVAAVRTRRHYLGFDTDPSYIELARERIAKEVSAAEKIARCISEPFRCGKKAAVSAAQFARELLAQSGFVEIESKRKLGPARIEVDFLAKDALGRRWAFGLAGSFTTVDSGLSKKEVLFEAIAKGAALKSSLSGDVSWIVLTTELPKAKSDCRRILDSVLGPFEAIRDVVVLGDPSAAQRLQCYARGGLD